MDNIYWIIEGELAGSSFPDFHTPEEYEKLNVTHIVNLTGKKYRNPLMYTKFKIHDLEIEDFSTPSINTVNNFFRIAEEAIQNKEVLLVHCWAGCGRTGTMLALWLMKFRNIDHEKAIKEVRKIRPCALETEKQVNFVKSYPI